MPVGKHIQFTHFRGGSVHDGVCGKETSIYIDLHSIECV